MTLSPSTGVRGVARSEGACGTVCLDGVRLLGAEPTDVLVRDGVIAAVGARSESVGARQVDATGLVMLPAFVDLHTHLREPGAEEAETIASGTRAAAEGGYSDVFAMANCAPITDTPRRLTHIAAVAARTAACRVHPVGAITRGLAGRELAPLAEMAAAGARMFSDDGRCVTDAAVMRAALAEARRTGTVVAQHAQCDRLADAGQINAGPAAERTRLPPWPGVAEESIVARDAVLAGETGAALHVCHVSTAGTVEVVRWAKQRGLPVTAEVAPHHLVLDDSLAATGDTLYKVNPPLRGAGDVAALRAALADGTIDAVATDHAPHPAHRKAAEWCDAPFGMLGLETALAIVAEVLTACGAECGSEPDWALIADLMAHTPARIGGVAAVAGRSLRPGEPATFTLVDPAADWTVDPADSHSLSRNSPYAERKFRCRPITTVVSGTVTSDRAGLLTPR
ncbi:dihydroorotase [Streptomyces osmaniensis]|uniref:Dihydroorotase n=1 Tax=Streptomyces osmaniensis TaxID=593134 RepID=A0ABP6XS49_9ACTN